MRVSGARPSHGPLHGLPGVFVAHGVLRTLVERHENIAAESELNVHGRFGRERVRIAVQVGVEDDAFLGDLANAREAEDLESAGISEDGARPGHKGMQTAETAEQSVTR